MSILTEEEKIAKYDAERAGTLYVVANEHVAVERHWSDEDDNPDAPPAGATEVWTDYECGTVLLGVYDEGRSNGHSCDINICRVDLGEPVTLALLTQIHTDLGHLLSDPRVCAALPVGTDAAPDYPPTRMVRIKDFTASCSFPMALSVNVGVAIERAWKSGKLDITRREMYDTVILVDQVIEDMFDLSTGLGILGTTPDKLADAAYQQGFQAALGAIKDFMELKEKSPEKALALVSERGA